MSVVIITLNIDTENSDETVPFCTLIEMLNQIKERIRTSNYTLDKYSTQTFDLMNGDDRAMVSIIGPTASLVHDPVVADGTVHRPSEAKGKN